MEKANDLLDENLWPLPRHTPKRCRAAKNRKGGPALSQRLRGPLNREWLSLEIWRLCRSQPLPEQGIRAVPRGAEEQPQPPAGQRHGVSVLRAAGHPRCCDMGWEQALILNPPSPSLTTAFFSPGDRK